ncbi:MAG: restriction endonuclease [Clostridia bacterium]|nr:restriction endonuclease [Clostridia bacterium]
MSVPKYNELFFSVLKCFGDNRDHNIKEIAEYCAKDHNLSENDINETIPSGQNCLINRVGWARTYLSKAGLVEKVSKGTYHITETGRKALDDGITQIDIAYLQQFESFNKFVCKENKNTPKENETITADDNISNITPTEQIQSAISNINSALSDDLIAEIMKLNSYDFEKLIVKLLIAMGYGSEQFNTAVTPKSRDGGIDGIITADKFGFDSVYVQAKKWDESNQVSRPDIQQFSGAMAGVGATKGVFITTSSFTKEAVNYANKMLNTKIVLVDGDNLTRLMIEYDVGVTTTEIYNVKKIDTDFFTDI